MHKRNRDLTVVQHLVMRRNSLGQVQDIQASLCCNLNRGVKPLTKLTSAWRRSLTFEDKIVKGLWRNSQGRLADFTEAMLNFELQKSPGALDLCSPNQVFVQCQAPLLQASL